MTTVSRFRSGKTGRVQSNGATVYLNKWSAKVTGDLQKVDNFESGGYHESVLGFEGCSWSVGGNWDATLDPYGDPPGLYPTDAGTSMKLYTSVSDGTFFSFPEYAVADGDAAADATGLVTFNANGESQGIFHTP